MFKSVVKRSYWLVLLLISSLAYTQVQPSTNGSFPAKTGRIYGKVVDAKTNKGIEAVSVQLYALPSGKLIGGMLSRSNGDFSFDNIPVRDSIRVIISAVGTAEIEQIVSLRNSRSPQKDLGNIKIALEAQNLEDVVVVGQKPALQMGIDRKVFNADKSLISTGGTAVDLMSSIPSVSVDVDGNVLLRNASPQILVDGRPTILSLDQIPADNIDRVELVTNPSAKYDAASTGGIINIVMKKNKKGGLNGMASLGIGTPGTYNGNLNANYREGKVNLFASANVNINGGKPKGTSYRENKKDGVITDYFTQNSINKKNNLFSTYRFGIDYFIDNRNTLSLTENITIGDFKSKENQEQRYLDNNKILQYTGSRFSESDGGFNRFGTQLLYKHSFAQQGKELTTDLTYNTGGGDNWSNILNNYNLPDGNEYKLRNRVRNKGKSNNDQWTLQLDYVNPISENAKLETGLRSYLNNYSSEYNSFSLAEDDAETKLPLSNNYKYREMINAVYITYTDKLGEIGYQVGLRAEQSKFDGELLDKSRKFGYNYPGKLDDLFKSFFPSLFLTKEIGEGAEIQLNYSRRIRRPDFWRLNPFIDINDPVNLRQGNPELQPEFTNALEFNYNKNYASGNFLGVLYYRNNQGDMTQYSDTISQAQYEELGNAAIDPNAILNTWINAKSTNKWGLELTLQQRLGKQFDFTPTLTMEYRKVNADIEGLNLSNEGFSWESKLTMNYKIPAPSSSLLTNMGLQAIGRYESPQVIPQGRRKEQYTVDVAVRKDLLKNKRGSITFSVNDVFDSRKFGMIYDTETFYQDFYRRRNVRSFKVTFAYKFGNPDFTFFKKDQRKGQREDDSEEMMP